jgi:hypothetical protein
MICVELEKSETETLVVIQRAYGKDALPKAQCLDGTKRSEKEERMSRRSNAWGAENVSHFGQCG